MTNIVFFLFRLYFRIFNSIKVSGLEKIPPRGPLIIVANHISFADPPALAAHVSLVRKISMLAKKSFSGSLPWGRCSGAGGPFPWTGAAMAGTLALSGRGLKSCAEAAALCFFRRALGRCPALRLNPNREWPCSPPKAELPCSAPEFLTAKIS